MNIDYQNILHSMNVAPRFEERGAIHRDVQDAFECYDAALINVNDLVGRLATHNLYIVRMGAIERATALGEESLHKWLTNWAYRGDGSKVNASQVMAIGGLDTSGRNNHFMVAHVGCYNDTDSSMSLDLDNPASMYRNGVCTTQFYVFAN